MLHKYVFQDSFCILKNQFFIIALIITLSFSCLNSFVLSVSQAFAQDNIEILEPGEGAELISKKPDIKCRFLVPFLKESLYIQIDQTDITALADVTQEGFSLSLTHVLPPGNHTLLITFLDQSNVVHTQQSKFSTRHSKSFETISTTNDLSFIYSHVIGKSNDAKNRSISDWEFESNLSSKSVISEGAWKVSFDTNARYTDQQKSTNAPVEDGFNIIDYTLKGKYNARGLTFKAALGDVSVQGTRNIINGLSRRGGTLGIETDTTFLTGFSLQSQQIYGIDDGEDAEPDNKDHLLGVTGGASFLDKKIDFKFIYVTGGEKSNTSSFGIWPDSAGTKGDALGFEIGTDFFDEKMTTLFEYDISDYDADISDNTGSKSDKAYFAKIGGNIDFFNYEAIYEYTGTDYKVVTSSLEQDRKGFSAKTGFSSQIQSIQLNYQHYNDNLDNDPAYARLDTVAYGVAYNLNIIPFLPVSLGWQRSLQDSSKEPAGSSEIKNTTDTIFGSISYIQGFWVFGVQPEYTQLNDETSINYDTESYTTTLFASYSIDRFSISSSVTWNQFKDISADVKNDTLNCNLSFSVNLYKGLDLEASGSYGDLSSNNDNIDQNNFNGDIQLSYQFQRPIINKFSPKILLRASHDSTKDKIADTSNNETIVYVMLSGSLNLSY